MQGDLSDDLIQQIVTEIIHQANQIAVQYNSNIAFTQIRYVEQNVHLQGQLAYIIKAQLP